MTVGRPPLEAVAEIARAAGVAILEVYGDDFTVAMKDDSSPVTAADERSEAIIVEQLRSLTPEIPIVSEEAAGQRIDVSAVPSFWLVDPLDGTKEFIGRNGEFTVNIALIEHGEPVLGVVYAPALGRLFAGAAGDGAHLYDADGRRPISVRVVPPEGATVVSSRSHGDADALAGFLSGRLVAASATAGSSLKFCLLAAGEADLYPRLGRTMEWDTAAGDAVLRAAGGTVRDIGGRQLRYGKPGFENPHFVAAGSEVPSRR